MFIQKRPKAPYYRFRAERCGGCDGHWRCYCEDTWQIDLEDSDMKILWKMLESRAILMNEKKASFYERFKNSYARCGADTVFKKDE